MWFKWLPLAQSPPWSCSQAVSWGCCLTYGCLTKVRHLLPGSLRWWLVDSGLLPCESLYRQNQSSRQLAYSRRKKEDKREGEMKKKRKRERRRKRSHSKQKPRNHSILYNLTSDMIHHYFCCILLFTDLPRYNVRGDYMWVQIQIGEDHWVSSRRLATTKGNQIL